MPPSAMIEPEPDIEPSTSTKVAPKSHGDYNCTKECGNVFSDIGGIFCGRGLRKEEIIQTSHRS